MKGIFDNRDFDNDLTEYEKEYKDICSLIRKAKTDSEGLKILFNFLYEQEQKIKI